MQNCLEDLADGRGNTQGACSDSSTKHTAYSQSPTTFPHAHNLHSRELERQCEMLVLAVYIPCQNFYLSSLCYAPLSSS